MQISNPKIAKCIGENIYLLGYNGPPEQLILMANKLVELFGAVELDDLTKVFNDFHSGEMEFKYTFNITHLTSGLRQMGYKTIKQKQQLETDNPYARHNFYNHSR